jgi:hypothetical protein
MKSPLAFAVRTLALACLLAGCDSGNPVIPEQAPNNPSAPTGGSQASYTLNLSLTPAALEAGSKTPGTLSVSAVSAETGRAPADGTLVSLNTNLGSFGSNGGGAVTSATLALQAGSASTSFFPDTAVGSATVLAQLGATITQLKVSFIEPAGLYLTSVSPAGGSAEGGERVSLFGGGFVEPLTVDFGGVQANVQSVDNGRIAVITPPATVTVAPGGTLAVDVTVNAALDQSKPKTATLRGGYIYGAAEDVVAFVTAVDPSSGGATGGETVRVLGGGFATPLQVNFGGKAGLEPALISAGEIRVKVPAPAAAPPAGGSTAVDVEVKSGLDQEVPQTATLPGGYTYTGAGVPTAFQITAISPTEGSFRGGTTVTVTGTGFAAPLAASLAGVRQSNEQVQSSTSMTFTTQPITVGSCPAGGRLAQVGVGLTRTDTGAAASAALTFFYTVPLPRITRVTPTNGTQLGNTVVNVQGSNFATTVRAEFLIGAEVYAGVVQSGGSDVLVRVSSPRLPDSAFPEGECTTSEGQAGKRYLQITAGLRVTNSETGCADTFGNSFTYTPSNTSCRPIGTSGS